MIPLVLASASPRRQSLLGALGVEFEIRVSEAKEVDCGETPAAIVENNAIAKCDAVSAIVDREVIVIAADTLVFLEEQVLSKPATLNEASAMLRRLSGNTHQVVTGLALRHTPSGRLVVGSESTDVTFRLLTDAEIKCFVQSVRPLDRAGAYTVDGPGSLLVSRYDGCYQNVLGLPMVRLDKLMRTLGPSLFDYVSPERAVFL